MSELLIPEHKPNFPLEDVSDKNAVLFEQLLLDPNYIFTIHELAEQHVTAFKLGHATIRSLGHVIYKNGQQQVAFSYGATLYEALSSTVKPEVRTFSENIRVSGVVNTILALRDDTTSAIMGIMDEEESFTEEMPTAAKLIHYASEFSPDFDKRLVLWGAALERSIDRDMMDIAA